MITSITFKWEIPPPPPASSWTLFSDAWFHQSLKNKETSKINFINHSTQNYFENHNCISFLMPSNVRSCILLGFECQCVACAQWNTIVVHSLIFVVIFLVMPFGFAFLSNHYFDLVEINGLKEHSQLRNW